MHPSRPVRAFLTLVVLAGAAVSCQPAASEREEGVRHAPGDAAREWAIGVDRVRAQLVNKEWTSVMGDATAAMSAYSAGDSLRLVREVLTQGDRGRSASRYYFEGSQLRYYESEGEVMGDGAVARKERLVLAFDANGAAVEVSRQLDGATAPVDSARIEGVLTRAAEVARQWATSPASAR